MCGERIDERVKNVSKNYEVTYAVIICKTFPYKNYFQVKHMEKFLLNH